MSLDTSKFPRDRLYRVFREGCNGSYRGAVFRDGVTVAPVKWRTANRLRAAWGSQGVRIEPWDAPAVPPPAPVPEPPAVATDLGRIGVMGRADLEKVASQLQLTFDPKVSTAKLRKLIEDAVYTTDDSD